MRFPWTAIVGVLALVFMLGCNPCTEEIWGTTASPNRSWVASTVVRDCGATTGEVLSVNIHRSEETHFVESNNAFVVKHGYAVHTSWRDNATLDVECTDCKASEVITKRDSVGGIQIVYSLP